MHMRQLEALGLSTLLSLHVKPEYIMLKLDYLDVRARMASA